jgi:hypothetical protein
MSLRDEIIRNNPLVEFLHERGCKLKAAGEDFTTSDCPIESHKNPGHRPVTIDVAKQAWHCNDHLVGGSVIDWVMHEKHVDVSEAMRILGGGKNSTLVCAYDYPDEHGTLLFQTGRFNPKSFRARRGPKDTKWKDGIKGVRRVLYNLPAVVKSQQVVIAEGEKNCDDLIALGFVPTTNPFGAGKWRKEYSEALRDKDVTVFGDIGDPDKKGEKHTRAVLLSLRGKARSLKHAIQPDGFHDVSDWLESLPPAEKNRAVQTLIAETPVWDPSESEEPSGLIVLENFYAYLPQHEYIFIVTSKMWPASSINSKFPPVGEGDDAISASRWLDQNRSVEEITWAPGLPMIIEGKLISSSGFIDGPGCATFNKYRPPNIKLGDAEKAGKWLDHVALLYPEDIDHIIRWFAHRVQRPQEKINHALLIIGPQGIGKDTMLYPVKQAVGTWNVQEILPPALLGRFNGFTQCVILCVNEVHDLGDVNRYSFYERLKAYTCAPPDIIRVDEKYLKEYAVLNVCGVVLTSNYKTGGLYLPEGDRRHYVAASGVKKEDFSEKYWSNIYAWFDRDGCRHVAAYLHALDISGFNPKAPPPKTDAFWEIVESNRAPENAELAGVLDRLNWPVVVTIEDVAEVATAEFATWLKDRRNARIVPFRFEECGYVAVRNPDYKADGRWHVGGKRCVIYAKRELSIRDQIIAARKLIEEIRT